MRGADVQQLGMFSYVSVEERVPADHPIRMLRKLVDAILLDLDALLSSRYAEGGRASIPPERLLRASLLQVVFSVRSERLLMEQMQYNLLFRWFVGLNIDDPVWDHSTFSFNRERLFDTEIAQRFFANTVLLARVQELMSDEHFSVDGTLLEAWASHKSFRRKDGDDSGDGGDFRGQSRSNDTHASTTDPDARARGGRGLHAAALERGLLARSPPQRRTVPPMAQRSAGAVRRRERQAGSGLPSPEQPKETIGKKKTNGQDT